MENVEYLEENGIYDPVKKQSSYEKNEWNI